MSACLAAFLEPWALLWLLLLVPLIVLYVLKRRRRERVVGSTLLWEEALRDLRAERPFRRLLPRVALLLQALAIVALAFALARPTGGDAMPRGSVLAVVVDV
ncbi:MAG: BatA domain-containing protein, partial [Myxococcota bacterium]